jgi:carbon-monoxide dehydrogenase medium subunit
MYPAPFEYHTPGSVEEAVSLLTQYEDEAKLLAGGHSLLPVMKLRFAQPKHVIDLRKIPALSGVRETDGGLLIGATTTHSQVEHSALLRRRVPILSEAAAMIGDAQVRNRGTVGGSLAHADPAADLPAVMLALGAEFRCIGPSGTRRIPADDFFLGLMTTALQPNEVLTEIFVPDAPARTGGAYEKLPHPASRFAVIGVAAVVTVGEGSVVRLARVAVTGLGTVAARARATEQALTGRFPENGSLDTAIARVTEGIELRDDRLGPPEFKANLARAYAARAIKRAVDRASA